MNKVSVAFLAGMLLVMGCQSSTDQEPFGNTVQASGEIFIPGERMGDPRNIQIYQDYLVVSNRKANPLIDVFDLASGERKSSFLSAGRGPLECLSVDIQSDPDHGFLYAFDMSQRKGLRYDFEKILRDSTTLPEVIYQRSDDSHLQFIMMTAGKEYLVASSSDPQGRILLLSKEGKEKGYFVDFPDKELLGKNLDDYNNADLYMSRIQMNPSGTRVVLATYMAGLIDMFTLGKEGPEPIFSYHKFYPEGISVVPGKERMVGVFSKDSRVGFISLCATDRYCYGLFSGKALSDQTGHLGEQVYVMSWDGKKTCIVQLDQGVRCIAVKPGDKTMYGINGHMDIVQFALPGM